MIDLESIPTQEEQEKWQAANADAAHFMPEARRIYKQETGKACNNFAMQRVLATLLMSLKDPQ